MTDIVTQGFNLGKVKETRKKGKEKSKRKVLTLEKG